MIARVWRGWASAERADDYQRHYESEVARQLGDVDGFRGARLLRRDDGGEVAFTSITYFDDLVAVRAFAGPGYQRAVVEDAAQRVLSRWDKQVTHHDVVADLSA